MTALLNLPFSLLAAAPFWNFGHGMWFNEQASTFAPKSDSLFMFIFWVSTFFFVLIVGLTIYFVIRYHRVEGVPAQRSPSHNTPLEVAWSTLPLLIMAVMFVWGFRGYMFMHVAPADAEEIDIKAQQWSWQMTYDNGAQSTLTTEVASQTVPIIPVPQGKPIKLLMHSVDVIHAFWVPDFRIKLDVMPNRYTETWFEATSKLEEHVNSEGVTELYTDHYLFCAEYCGTNHALMAAVIRVMPPDKYEAMKADFADIFKGRTLPEVGAILFNSKGCVACHTVDGTRSTGPSWLGIYGSTQKVRLPNNSLVDQTVDDDYLRESILVPAAKIVDTFTNQMTSYQGQLSDQELEALISYIKSIGTEGGS